MRGTPRERDVKAAAIAALILGDSPTEVANRYTLPRGTVRNWQPEAEKLAEVSRISGGGISDLVEGYVVSGIESLTAQAKQARNLEWLRNSRQKNWQRSWTVQSNLEGNQWLSKQASVN